MSYIRTGKMRAARKLKMENNMTDREPKTTGYIVAFKMLRSSRGVEQNWRYVIASNDPMDYDNDKLDQNFLPLDATRKIAAGVFSQVIEIGPPEAFPAAEKTKVE
jgi:hypothetical protein